jgi:hypothetical protein
MSKVRLKIDYLQDWIISSKASQNFKIWLISMIKMLNEVRSWILFETPRTLSAKKKISVLFFSFQFHPVCVLLLVARVARFFQVHDTKTVKNVPMNTKCTKWA